MVIALVLLNAARFLAGFAFDLVPQEAYYLQYAQHLALSYFDHPPALAYLLRVALELLGPRELAPRLCAFLLSVGTQLLWIDLARRHLGDRWPAAAWLFLSTGLFAVTSLISTPDVPLLFFWTLGLRWLWQAVFDERRAAWLLAGVALGLAFDSKYTGLALQGGLVLFLVAAPAPAHRRWLRTPWPYLCLLLAQLLMAPVYLWNAQHGFASFAFQTQERVERATGLTAVNFAKLVATQSALVGPFLLAALGLVCLRPRKLLAGVEPAVRDRRLFLFCFFAPTFALFVAISAFALVKPNWLMPCYLAGALLAVELLPKRWAVANVALCLALHVLAGVELVAYPVAIQSDDTWKGWRALGAEVNRLVAERPGAFVFSADGYKTAAELRFYSTAEVYGPNVLGQRGLQFDYLDPDLSKKLRGRDAWFLDSAPTDLSPDLRGEAPADLRERFMNVKELPPLIISERGRPVRKFYLYWCESYREGF